MTDQEYIQAMGWLAGQKLKAFAELNAYGKTDEPGTALAGFEEEYGKAAQELEDWCKKAHGIRKKAAAELNFEAAAQLRDQMVDLKKMLQNA